MDSPKRMANISIGANGLIGIVSSTPINEAPQPHWKTATSTPYAAPMLSRLRAAALRGTHTDRKTGISTSSDSSRTAPMNHGMRDWSLAATSTCSADDPVTMTSPPWSRLTAGSTSAAQLVDQTGGRLVLG